VAAIVSPLKGTFPLMNGREYNVNEEICGCKWGVLDTGDGYERRLRYQLGRSL
jgi:hypothetical protein